MASRAPAAGDDDTVGYSTYQQWQPKTTADPHQPSHTFDFKVIIIAAKSLYTPAATATASAPVSFQLQLLDTGDRAISEHFSYRSSVKNGPNPEWRESVLLKHLPLRPCSLTFTFYTSDTVIGTVIVPSSVLTRFHGDSNCIYSRWHTVDGSDNGQAQFHYVIAPAEARLRHLTAAQSMPPPLVLAAKAVPVSQSVELSATPVIDTHSVSAQTIEPVHSNGKFNEGVNGNPVTITSVATVVTNSDAARTADDHGQAAHTAHSTIDLLSTPPVTTPIEPQSRSTGQSLDAALEAENSMTLEQKQKRDAMRDRACQEFLHTERTYVTNLSILAHEFVTPLQTAVSNHTLNLSSEIVNDIINNIPTLHSFHLQFLGELEQRIQSSPLTAISSTVNKYSAFMRLYVQYVSQYQTSLQAINTQQRTNKSFQQFLNSMRERLNEISILDLTSYLIMPVQRVPRYVLLLQEIGKYTGPLSPDYHSLRESLESIKRVAAYVNEGKRECENISKLVDIQERISDNSNNKCPQLVAPARRFLLEGSMERVSHSLLQSAKYKQSSFFLFNDLILWANHNHAYKGSIELVTASLDIKEKDKLILDISSARHHLSIKFPNIELYVQWADTIQSLIDELQRERNKNRVLYRDLKSRRKQMNGPVSGNGNDSGGSTSPSTELAPQPPAVAASGVATPVESVTIPVDSNTENVHSLIAEKLRELQLNKVDVVTEMPTHTRESSNYYIRRVSATTDAVGTTPRRPSHDSNLSLTASDSFGANTVCLDGTVDGTTASAGASLQNSPPQNHTAGVLLHHHRQTQALRELKAELAAKETSVSQSQSSFVNALSYLPTPLSLPTPSSLSHPSVISPVSPPTVVNLCLCLDRAEGKRNSLKLFGTDGSGVESLRAQTVRCPLHSLPEA